jgi:3,4-dihydroxy-2-butanone 4-phosphate synthase
MNTTDLVYQAKLSTARQFINMMKEDDGFFTFWSLEDIAERIGLEYEDIKDLENYLE